MAAQEDKIHRPTAWSFYEKGEKGLIRIGVLKPRDGKVKTRTSAESSGAQNACL
jgi:hypothetical protein